MVIRVAYVLAYRHPAKLSGDAVYYRDQAQLITQGHWFVNPYTLAFFGHLAPSADHPPVWTLLLVLGDVLGFGGVFAQILWSCLLGSLSVALVGLAAGEMAGRRAGLLAAAGAAVYPVFVIDCGALMSETAVLGVTALTLWAFYRFWHRPTVARAAWVGAFVALGTLTRSETVLLVPLLVLPLGWYGGRRGLRSRLGLSAAAMAATLAVFAPWWAYNIPRFADPSLFSNQLGLTLVNGNCRSTYYGPDIGYWDFACPTELGLHLSATGDPSVQDHILQRAAENYMRQHASRLPVVVAARVGREFGLFDPWQQIVQEWQILGRPRLPATIGLACWYAAALAAIPGAVVLRRRRVPLGPPAVMVVATVVVAAATFGQTRYRTMVDVVVVVLAAVAADAVLGRRRPLPSPTSGRERPATTTGGGGSVVGAPSDR